MAPDDNKTHTHAPLASGTMLCHQRLNEKIVADGMGKVCLAEVLQC